MNNLSGRPSGRSQLRGDRTKADYSVLVVVEEIPTFAGGVFGW